MPLWIADQSEMAARLDEEEPSQLTARKLEAIKSWARKREDRLGKEHVGELANVAEDV